MQGKTALVVFGSFLAINLAGFGGAVVLQELRGGVADEDRYGGLGKEAFAARVVSEGVAALESAPVDAMAVEMVAKTEAGDEFATMTVAVSKPQRAKDMHGRLDFDILRRFTPPEDQAQGFDLDELEEKAGEFRVTQVEDVLTITFGGETYVQRGVADTDFGSISNFAAEPVPGLADEGGAGSADPSGFFGVLERSTEGLTIHKISEGKYQATRAWRVEASFEDEESKGTMVFIASVKDGFPLLVTMKVGSPDHAEIPPADITFAFTYGEAVVIAVPSAEGATRLPATFHYELVDETPTRFEGIISEGSSPVPLDEIDLRVVEHRPPSADSMSLAPVVSKVVAALRLDAGDSTTAGYELTFTDNGDGVLSPGDRFVAKAPASKPFKDPQQVNGTWQPGVGVKFYDRWAAAYEGAPGPGMAVGLFGVGAAVALVAALRRRKNEP